MSSSIYEPKSNRRRWDRAASEAECKVWQPGALRSAKGRLFDISTGGAGMVLGCSPATVPIGSSIRVALDPSTPVLCAESMIRGRVVRVEEAGYGESRLGVMFETHHDELI